jgi:hypothetical protein
VDPGERPAAGQDAPEANNRDLSGFPETSDIKTGDGVSKGKARATKRARDEHDQDGERAGGSSRLTKRPKTESAAMGPSISAGPSTPVAPEGDKHRMTAGQVEEMLRRLAKQVADHGEGRWVSKIAGQFPGKQDPNRKWLTVGGWKQKNHAQTLSRMPDYPEHRASIQDLVNRLDVYDKALPEPQESYHLRFTAENLLAVLRSFGSRQSLSASERKRSAFKYVERQTGISEKTLKRFLYKDGGLAVSPSQISRLPGYAEHRAQLQEAFRRLGHNETAHDLPEPGARHVEEMTADVVAAALKRLAANPDRSMVGIGRELGFDRQALQRYLGPGNEGLRRQSDLAGLPNYAAQRDAIAAALRAMGRDDQADRLSAPGRLDETAGAIKPRRSETGASLSARGAARGPAGLPTARAASPNERLASGHDALGLSASNLSDLSEMSDVESGGKASKGKGRADISEMSDAYTDHDSDASGEERESELADSDTERSGLVEGNRHMMTAQQVEAMLRRLEIENRNPPGNRATLIQIGGQFHGDDQSNARWLSASTWETAQLDIVLSRTVDYEQHRASIQDLVNRLGVYNRTLPAPERHYHHQLTAAELVAALNSREDFNSASHAERRGGAQAYMRKKAGLADSPVLEKWLFADGRLKSPLGQLNSLPGYAANRSRLQDVFRRLGHTETAEILPEPSGRNVEEMTADVVAAALERLAINPDRSMGAIGRELGFRSDALLRYIGPRTEGLRGLPDVARLANYDAQRRNSIAAALEAMGQPEQARTLPVPQVMHAADFLRMLRVHRRQVADAIERMRQDPTLSPRDAAIATDVPSDAFSLAVDRGPTIRDQSRVEDQLSRVEPELRRGLDQMFERLGALARGDQVDGAVGMTAVELSKNPIAPSRLFIVENPELEGKAYQAKLKRLYDANPALVRDPRSYADDRPRQLLRWMSTVLKEQFAQSGEVQSYYDAAENKIFVSSNTAKGNKRIRALLDADGPGLDSLLSRRESERQISRETRHWTKLKNALSNPHPHANKRVDEILAAIRQNRFHVPGTNYQSNGETVDVHAERRIKNALEALNLSSMDLNLLAGTLRACGHCAADLGVGDDQTRGPFWQSKGANYRLDGDRIMSENMENSVGTFVTRTRGGRITADYNTDSEASSDELARRAGQRRASGSAGTGALRAKGTDAGVKGKGAERSSADLSEDADLGEEKRDQWDDLDRVQLDSMLNRWDALPSDQELDPDPDEIHMVERIRRGVRLPADLADRFARRGVRGPRYLEEYWPRQQNSQAGPSGSGHPDDPSPARGSSAQPSRPDSSMSVDPPDDDVEMADASRGDDPDLDAGSDAGSTAEKR